MTCLCPAMSRGLAPPLVLGKMVADNFVWTVYNGQYGTVWTYMYYIVLYNSAARLLCNRRKYDHITPLLRDVLHWLPVPLRVEFKICLLVYKSLHGAAP